MVIFILFLLIFTYFWSNIIPSFTYLTNFYTELAYLFLNFTQWFFNLVEGNDLGQIFPSLPIVPFFGFLYWAFYSALTWPFNDILIITIVVFAVVLSESVLFFAEQKYEIWRKSLTNKKKLRRWELVEIDFFSSEEQSDVEYFDFLTNLTSVDGMSWRELRHLVSCNCSYTL